MTIDKPNKNGRIYPRQLMEKEIERLKKEISENRCFITKRQPETTTHLINDIVGLIKDIQIEDDKVVIEAEFFPDNKFIETGIKSGDLSMRTSGVGTIHKQEDDTYIIDDDYKLIGCFITTDPA